MDDPFYILCHPSLEKSSLPLNDQEMKTAVEVAKSLIGHSIASLCYGKTEKSIALALLIAAYCHCNLHIVEELESFYSEKKSENDEQLILTSTIKTFNLCEQFPSPLLILSSLNFFKALCSELKINFLSIEEKMVAFHVYQELGKWVMARVK